MMSETTKKADDETPQYVVVLRASSAVKFEPTSHLRLNRLRIDTGPTDFTFQTRYVEEGFDVAVPRELWVDVRGPAPSLNEAIKTFARVAQDLSAILALGANAAIKDLAVELAYDMTPGRKEREFFQGFVPDERGVPLLHRRPDAKAVAELSLAVSRHRDSPRLLRAIGHYYHALQNWEPGQETMAVAHLWIAVENLTQAAIRRLAAERQLPEDDRDGLAAAVGIDTTSLEPHAVSREVNAWVRKEVIFAGDGERYREAKEASDSLEHGYRGLGDVHAVASGVRDDAAAHVRRAILELCELEAPHRRVLLDSRYSIPLGGWRWQKHLRGKLIADTDDLAHRDQEYPIFRWASGIKSLSRDNDGRYHLEPYEKLTAKLGEGVRFQGTSFIVWGPKEGDEPTIVVTGDSAAPARPAADTDEFSDRQSLFALNSRHVEKLVPLVGKVVINMGALELLTYRWIRQLSGEESFRRAFDRTFEDRVQEILGLLKREEVPEAVRESAIERWKEVLELSEVRDAVARNPVIFGWHGPEQEGEPDFLGIPLAEKMHESPEGETPYLSIEGLRLAVDAIVAAARHLGDLLGQFPGRPGAE